MNVANWKTSLAGALSVIIGGLIYNGYLTPEAGGGLISLLTGLGLIAAKDQ